MKTIELFSCTSQKQPSPVARPQASKPFCRICHEFAPESRLISPCDCIGSVRTVHRRCLENWLTISRTSKCEMCNFTYECRKSLPTVFDWLKRNPRPMIVDLILALFMTPLAIFSVILCYRGAAIQVEWKNTIESLCLFALGSFLTGVYLAWLALTVRAQIVEFKSWQIKYPRVRLAPSSSPNIITCNRVHVDQTLSERAFRPHSFSSPNLPVEASRLQPEFVLNLSSPTISVIEENLEERRLPFENSFDSVEYFMEQQRLKNSSSVV